MAAFGLGTLPAMLATGTFSNGVLDLLRRKGARLPIGTLIVLYGIWTIPFIQSSIRSLLPTD